MQTRVFLTVISASLGLAGKDVNLDVFCCRKQITMNMQWMKTKIPQTLMNTKIAAGCWTFLRPVDAAHVTPEGLFNRTK